MNTEPKPCPCYRESIIKAWNALPRRLQWTKKLPSNPGIYLYDSVDGKGAALVFRGDNGLEVKFVPFDLADEFVPVEDVDAATNWIGPIDESDDMGLLK